MDYAKKSGGTRIHDKVRLRALATGIGQSEAANHETGSSRMRRVAANLKPGQLVHDPALAELHGRHMDEMERMGINAHMDPPSKEQAAANAWPLESMHKKSHLEAGTITAPQPSDQGEQTRQHVTGRAAHPSNQVTPVVAK